MATIPPAQRPKLSSFPPVLTLAEAAAVLGIPRHKAVLMKQRGLFGFPIHRHYVGMDTVLKGDLQAAIKAGTAVLAAPGDAERGEPGRLRRLGRLMDGKDEDE